MRYTTFITGCLYLSTNSAKAPPSPCFTRSIRVASGSESAAIVARTLTNTGNRTRLEQNAEAHARSDLATIARENAESQPTVQVRHPEGMGSLSLRVARGGGNSARSASRATRRQRGRQRR